MTTFQSNIINIYGKKGKGFCCKNIFRPRTELFWASLRRQSIELFKNSLIGRFSMLIFSEHVMQFNAR